jgi:hypothetical protein
MQKTSRLKKEQPHDCKEGQTSTIKMLSPFKLVFKLNAFLMKKQTGFFTQILICSYAGTKGQEEMDKFLNTYHPPKLNQEDINTLNRSIISNENKIVIRIF